MSEDRDEGRDAEGRDAGGRDAEGRDAEGRDAGGRDSGQQGRLAGLKRRFADVRRRYPPLDHLLRAWTHYGDCRGNELAGAVTYFGFLSFFPLLALTFAAVAFAAEYDADFQSQVTAALRDYLPGLVGEGENQIAVEQLIGARQAAVGFGAVGLLYAGLGWVNGLREALRQLFVLPKREGNIVVNKLSDLLFLLMLGVGLLLSLAVSSLASTLTQTVLELVGLDGSGAATLLLTVLAPLLSIGVTTAVLLLVFTRMAGRSMPWRQALEGAVIGAVAIQVLLLVGGLLVGRTQTNTSLYGTFAVVVGLLVWMNLLARVTLLAASWAATDRQVRPRTEAERESPLTGEAGAGRGTSRRTPAPPAGSAPTGRAGAGAVTVVAVAALAALRLRNVPDGAGARGRAAPRA